MKLSEMIAMTKTNSRKACSRFPLGSTVHIIAMTIIFAVTARAGCEL